MTQNADGRLAGTGIEGLDDVLNGGFERRRLFLIEGAPGAGKTTLGMQFLLQGAAAGEKVVYVTLSESEEELRGVGESHGWDLDAVRLIELQPMGATVEPDEQSTMFHPSEIELARTISQLLADIEKIDPTRIVFDSLSEMRLIAGNALRYRRQILGLKKYFSQRAATVMMLDDLTAIEHDLQVQSIAHGVIALEQMSPEYGSDRRRIRVLKYRGHAYRGGYHDYTIKRGGLEVYPRIVAAEHPQLPGRQRIASGVVALDQLLGGGLEKGTSTLFVGGAGTGKSTLAAQFVAAYAAGGGRAAMYIFDESPATLLDRTSSLGIAFGEAVTAGRVALRQIDPAELSPGEFAQSIRKEVEAGAGLIVVDSLNGYLNAMPAERYLTIQLHELLAFLGQKNVATILLSAHHGLIGSNMTSPVDASYLADAIVLLRYFESDGEVRQAISVMKKRGSRHERTIREFSFDANGIRVGEPLRDFRGILTGVPVRRGEDRVPGEERSTVNPAQSARDDRRLLLLPPTARDGETTRSLLAGAGIASRVCADLGDLFAEVNRGVGAILLTEEASGSASEELSELLDRQPPWSDLPLLVLARPGADSVDSTEAVRRLGNVTLLERPVRIASLLSAARSALRARDRQYQIRDQVERQEQAERSLRDNDRRKDEFLATLGHELRNPLAPLSTSLALLKLTSPSDGSASESIAVIERQVTHLKRLVDDLLEVSRITRGLIEVRREPIDLIDILRASIENARTVLARSRHAFVAELPAEVLPLRGDAVRLIQVFSNLLHNAAKYTEEGGNVSLSVRRAGDEVVVEVTDNGIGIAPENLDSIFDMFTQVDRSARRAQGGLGIGLTLAKSLLDTHGGVIRARSAGLGRGSTFEVRLPLAAGIVASRTLAHDLPAFDGRSILVADDNRDAAEAMGALLRSLGATVVVVYGGPEALAACERSRPETAILDIGMPHMDGFEVARRIRNAPWGSEVVLIALSGWGQEDDVRRSSEAGFDHHFVKPADIDELWRKVTLGRRVSLHARSN